MKFKRLLAAFALLCGSLAFAQTKTPLVQPEWTFFDQSGAACAGCSLYTYLAGTTTPTPTYTDASGLSVNTNPIILNAAGTAQIWVGTPTLKLILKDSFGTTIWTADNIPGNGGSGGCGFAGSITFENSTISGLDCDQYITINKVLHTINVGGPLPATHFTMTNLSAILANWTFDISSPAKAFNTIQPMTTKGDLICYSTTATRLATATDGYVLTTDSTQPCGVKWASGAAAINQLTGDVTAGPGSGSQVATLAASGVTAGSYGDANNVPQLTLDAKGRVTAAANVPIGGTFTGTSGYQIIAPGIILEYGLADSASSSTSVTFPYTFPHAVFAVTFGTANYNLNASRNVCYVQGSPPSTTGFTAQTDASTVHCFWMAIGW